MRSIAELVKILTEDRRAARRVSAAREILNAGYGPPAVGVGFVRPLPEGLRAYEARFYAADALEVLRKIVENGRSETAKVAAAAILLDRAAGLVASSADLDFRGDGGATQ